MAPPLTLCLFAAAAAAYGAAAALASIDATADTIKHQGTRELERVPTLWSGWEGGW